MKTHSSVTIWLNPDDEVKVVAVEGCAWASMGYDLTFHVWDSNTRESDLNALEAFFTSGLAAVQQARHEQLTLTPQPVKGA